MMYDEMLTLICQAIEICVLSTEEACCPFLISFLALIQLNCSIPFTEGKTSSFDSSGEEDTDDENEQNGNVEVSLRLLSVLFLVYCKLL